MKSYGFPVAAALALSGHALMVTWMVARLEQSPLVFAVILISTTLLFVTLFAGYRRMLTHEAMIFKENVAYDAFLDPGELDKMDLKAFLNVLFLEKERLATAGGQSSILLFDVDDFERINRRHGSELADHLLEALLRVVRREMDGAVLARVRGDAFVLLLSGASRQEGLEKAEKLRRTLRHLKLPGLEPVSCTFSVVAFDEETSSKDLFREAEALLKKGKALGKDQVV